MRKELLSIVAESGEIDYELLRRYTDWVDPGKKDRIDWKRVEHLYIFGYSWELEDLMSGFYVSDDATWVLAYSVGIFEAESILDSCGQRLEWLDIWDLELSSLDVSAFSGLRHLSYELEGHPRPCVVKGLSRCTMLTEVYLFSMLPDSELDVSGLTELRQLQFIPGNTAFRKKYPVVGVEGLEKLEQLTLYGMYAGGEIDVSRLTALQWLDLGGNRALRKIKGLEHAKELEGLSLSQTGVRELPAGIRSLKKLQLLELCSLELDAIPSWLPELGMDFSMTWQESGIILEHTRIRDVDMSIFWQPREMILRWFEEQKVPLDEIKVVFLGDGGAGKTHTIARLRNHGGDPIEYVGQRTPGILIKDACYPVGGRNVTMHIWDFGGQEIMHSMHRIFLTERTVYVVVVDVRIGNHEERARYWLRNLQSFAKDAPVILILNKLDNDIQADVNAVELLGKYSSLKKIVKLSALEYSQKDFNEAFTNVLLEQIELSGYLNVRWPASWVRVKQRLQTENSNFIEGETYETICSECGVEEHRELLHWFNDLGVSFCCYDDPVLKEYVVLRPDWITNALYIILNNERKGAEGGLVPIQTIRDMLSPSAPNRDQIERVLPGVYYRGFKVDCILQVLRRFRLSFNKNGNYEFIPMLADLNARSVAKEYEADEATLEFRMEFDYLPNNVLHQLVVERQEELDMANVWRTGARFVQQSTGLSAVVTIDDTKLKILVRHDDDRHRPNTYLDEMKGTIDRIWRVMGLKEPKNVLVHKVGGERAEFNYARLLKMYARGRTTEYSESLDRDFRIEDILNQSAPAMMEEAERLLNAILRSCRKIQGTEGYIKSHEDVRNERMFDDLETAGYNAHSQYTLGLSASGRSAGKLDIVVKDDGGRIMTIIEALRISDGGKTVWNQHLNKLLDNYNAHGAPYLFLVTYVDSDITTFTDIRRSYELHIDGHSPDGFWFVEGSFSTFLDEKRGFDHFIWTAKCRYDCGGYTPTVYHIFVRMRTER